MRLGRISAMAILNSYLEKIIKEKLFLLKERTSAR
jgi:hypothetical protein